MIIPDLEGLTEFLDSMSNKNMLKITGNISSPDVKERINTILLHHPGATLRMDGKVLKIQLSKGSRYRKLTSDELVEQFAIKNVELTKELKTERQTTAGLFYSPLADTVMYYSRANNNVILNTTEMLPGSKAAPYLDGAVNLYEKHLKEFLPAVRLLEANRVQAIRESQLSRGFTNVPEVNDVVEIIPYAELVTMYGEDTTSASVHFIKGQSATYGIPFVKPLKYLEGGSYRITEINNTSGIVKLYDENNGTHLDTIDVIEIDGVKRRLSPAPKFHEQILRKL